MRRQRAQVVMIAALATCSAAAAAGTKCPTAIAPVIPAASPRFRALAAGSGRTCGITTTDTVVCWGSTYRDPLTPLAPVRPREVAMPAGFQPADAIGVGLNGACVLGKDGTVACWGSAAAIGRSGGDSVDAAERVDGVTGAVVLAVTRESACAVTARGEVLCWGNPMDRHLERGNGAPRPVRDVAGAVDVAVTDELACARLGTGRVICWKQEQRQILLPGIDDAVALSADSAGVCVARATGDVVCSREVFGEAPVVLKGLGNAVALAGEQEGCAIDRNGNVDCWAWDRTVTRVPGVRARRITVAETHRCALDDTGVAWCWGGNQAGELGRRTDTVFLTPQTVCGLDKITQVTAGEFHTCALTHAGRVACFGAAFNGQLGPGHDRESGAPVWVDGVVGATAVSAGARHTCAILRNRRVVCWGANYGGQATGTSTEPPVPPTVVPGVGDAVEITASNDSTCARRSDGRVICWGELAIDGERITAPRDLAGISDAIQLAAFNNNLCVLRRGGRRTCWGRDSKPDRERTCHCTKEHCHCEGSLPRSTGPQDVELKGISRIAGSCALGGNGTLSCRQSVTFDPTTLSRGPITSIAMAGSSLCAIARGQVRCSLYPDRDWVRPFGDDRNVVQVSLGRHHVCVVRKSGLASCWGENELGQVGAGTTGMIARPLPVAFEP